MPESIAPPDIDTVSLEEEPLLLDQDIADKVALALVNKSYLEYESRRSNNADNRWKGHDLFYTAYVPPRSWEGTNIPRSSVGVPITFDQVESAHSKILQTILEADENWFEVVAGQAGNPKQAAALSNHLDYCFEQEEVVGASSFEREFSLAVKEVVMYGNGGVLLQYHPETRRPVPEFISIKDLYVDTGLSCPDLQKSRSVVVRKTMTVDELDGMRDEDSQLKIPSRAVLTYLSENTPFVNADTTKNFGAAVNGFDANTPKRDDAPNPSDKKVEVFIFYSKTRIIWVLGRRVVAFNEKNPYGIIPLFFAPCYTFPNQFYGKSMIDVNETNQAVIQALINGYLDNKALELFPPRVQKNSGLMTPGQQRWRPGAVFKADEAKDIAVLQPAPSQSVFQDIAWFQAEAEKRSGISSLMGGVPRPSNANRTFSGMQAQIGGSDLRLYPIIKNIEDYMLLPMLYGMLTMLRFHINDNDELVGGTPEQPLTGADLKHATSFKCLAATRMVTKDQLKQVFPFIVQYMLAGPFVGSLQKEGKTIDFDVLAEMLQVAAGTKKRFSLIRPMTPQESQAIQQEQAQAQQAQQADNQTKMQIAQMGSQTQITTAQIAAQAKHTIHTTPPAQAAPDMSEVAMMQMEQQAKAQESQAKVDAMREKTASDAQMQAMKLQFEQAKQQLAMKAQADKMQMEAAASQQKLQAGAMESQLNLQGKSAETALNLRAQQQQHELGVEQQRRELSHKDASNKMDLEHSAALGQEKIRLAKETKAEPARKKAEVKKHKKE